MATLPKLKLYYFELPGRAETIRIILRYADIPFENYVITRDEWPALKPTMPFGQVPVLEVDGKKLAESAAIERYVARLAKLLPEDHFLSAKCFEIKEFLTGAMDLFRPTFSIKDPAEKIKAREAIVNGALKDKLAKLSDIVEANGGEHIIGNTLTYTDIVVYEALSSLTSGFLDGVPTTLLDSYPTLKAFHHRIASIPKIAEQYKDVTEGLRLAYKPKA